MEKDPIPVIKVDSEVKSDEISLETINALRKKVLSKIAYVPENGGIYPEMSVFEYLTFNSLRYIFSS